MNYSTNISLVTTVKNLDWKYDEIDAFFPPSSIFTVPLLEFTFLIVKTINAGKIVLRIQSIFLENKESETRLNSKRISPNYKYFVKRPDIRNIFQ